MLGIKPHVCLCGGYHFPHRRGGGACEHSPTRDFHLAIRAGEHERAAAELLSLLASGLGKHLVLQPPTGHCPF